MTYQAGSITRKIYHACNTNPAPHLHDTNTINGLTMYWMPIKGLTKYGKST